MEEVGGRCFSITLLTISKQKLEIHSLKVFWNYHQSSSYAPYPADERFQCHFRNRSCRSDHCCKNRRWYRDLAWFYCSDLCYNQCGWRIYGYGQNAENVQAEIKKNSGICKYFLRFCCCIIYTGAEETKPPKEAFREHGESHFSETKKLQEGLGDAFVKAWFRKT